MRLASAVALADIGCVGGFAWGLSHLVTLLWGRPATLAAILPAMIMVVLSVAVRAALGLAGQKLNLMISRRIIVGVRSDVMGKALDGRIRDAARLNTLFEDTEALEGYYARFRQARSSAAIAPLLLIALIARQSPVSAGLLGLTLVPFIGMMAILGMSSAAESTRQLDALARLSNLFIDRIRALPLILAFEDGPRQVGIIGRAARDVAERTLRVLRIAFVTSAVLEFFSALSVALIAVYCGFYLLHQLPFPVPERLTLEKAFFVLALSPEVFAPMRRLSAAYHDRQTAIAAAERLMALPVTPELAPAPLPKAAPLIRFENVTCGFSDDPGFRIGPLSFTALPGSVTALTGPTGAGKTTLLRLLLGQGEIIDGLISLDGQPVRDAGPSIGWVSQATPILAGTLRDNLVLTNTSASEAEVTHAISLTGLDELVMRRGLDT
ncbi:MAG: ATP-binding cassette domain-containing protein, partial [Asticcacaulis sp.]